jgi:hypothetical protein
VLDRDLAGGQQAHDVDEQATGNNDCSLVLDLRFERGA